MRIVTGLLVSRNSHITVVITDDPKFGPPGNQKSWGYRNVTTHTDFSANLKLNVHTNN